jgi:hypothetical protein
MPADSAWVESGFQSPHSSRVDQRQHPLALTMRCMSTTTVALRLHQVGPKVLFSGERVLNPILFGTLSLSRIQLGKSRTPTLSLQRLSSKTISQSTSTMYANAPFRVVPTILRQWLGKQKVRLLLPRHLRTCFGFKPSISVFTDTSTRPSISPAMSTSWLMTPLVCLNCLTLAFSPILTLCIPRRTPGV